MAKTNFYPVILAGGRGTRFWPLSRQRKAKQLLALDGKQTMIQQTVSRLLPLASPKRFWIISNEHLRREILRQLPRLSADHVLAEPAARNTAPAIGLAAFMLMNSDPDAVIGLFPSDHVIGDEKRYRDVLKKGIEIAAAGENIVVLGIRPTRAETGYGYIEAGSPFKGDALRARRFTEKPDAARAAEFVKAATTSGTAACFCGARVRWPTHCSSICRRRQLLLRADCCDLRHAQICRDICPAVSQVREHQHRLCSAGAALAKGEQKSNIYLPAAPISGGTIWARGRHCTNTT